MNRFSDANTLEEVVFQAIGAGSVCWEGIREAGVFESERAKQIGDEAVERLRQLGIPDTSRPRFLAIGLYRYPPVDPITGEVSAADDAISMGDMAHEDVPMPHRNPDCDFVMDMHKWIDDGSEYGIVICP